MWSTAEREEAGKMLGVVCEVTGTSLSKAAQILMLLELETSPALQVLSALRRCATECRFKLTLADIVSRIDDGRPGAEAAWASFPKSEADAAVVTDEMAAAWGVVASLHESDPVAARMAFKESYEKAVREAKAEKRPVRWFLSGGTSKAANEAAAIEGLRRNLLSEYVALQFVAPERRDEVLEAAGRSLQFAGKEPATPSGLQAVRDLLRRMEKPA